MNEKTADETIMFFEEARVVLYSLDERIMAFNEASERLDKSIESFKKVDSDINKLGEVISKKIYLKNIEEEVSKSVEYLFDADLEIRKYSKSINDFRFHYLSIFTAIIISSTFASLITFTIIKFDYFEELYHLFF
ncbi:hypothetical protein [Arcobacter arenosus]|uniref:Uncharacterized protein n=1 Tax=Arcobacter arenosus TaxID=2576037 RepID=A0A5R8XYX1_9BACT|nr:hypothetical protein [Arcobacter arenosus]TLP36207.1 hypothetical protein FDK22_13130 [Arcobacter arenosus]